MSPGGQNTPPPHIGVGCQTTTLGGPTARTCAAPSTPASSTSAAPRVAPTTSTAPHATPSTPPAPRTTPASTTIATPPVAPERYLLHYSHRPRATREPPALPLHQQSLSVKALLVAPPVNPLSMTMWANRGFRLPPDRLTLSATSAPTLSLVPSFVYATLVDPNWRRAMEEEFAASITNNTLDLVVTPTFCK
jgi:hypothetical protein